MGAGQGSVCWETWCARMPSRRERNRPSRQGACTRVGVGGSPTSQGGCHSATTQLLKTQHEGSARLHLLREDRTSWFLCTGCSRQATRHKGAPPHTCPTSQPCKNSGTTSSPLNLVSYTSTRQQVSSYSRKLYTPTGEGSKIPNSLRFSPYMDTKRFFSLKPLSEGYRLLPFI